MNNLQHKKGIKKMAKRIIPFSSIITTINSNNSNTILANAIVPRNYRFCKKEIDKINVLGVAKGYERKYKKII